MTPAEALTKGLQTWLDATVPTKSASVKSEDVDPFVSSMRYPWQMIEGMRQAATGPISTSDPQQRFGDLQRAGLLTGGAASPALTPLGRAAVDGWKRHDVLDQTGDAKDLEFTRNVILLDVAWTLAEPRYLVMLDWWAELRNDRPAVDWFADEWSLIAATFLRVSQGGYNPYRVMVAAGTPHWAHKDDLVAWAGSMPVPSGFGKSRLAVVLDRIGQHASRASGKVRFYQALEAVTLRNKGATATELRATFTSWGLS